MCSLTVKHWELMSHIWPLQLQILSLFSIMNLCFISINLSNFVRKSWLSPVFNVKYLFRRLSSWSPMFLAWKFLGRRLLAIFLLVATVPSPIEVVWWVNVYYYLTNVYKYNFLFRIFAFNPIDHLDMSILFLNCTLGTGSPSYFCWGLGWAFYSTPGSFGSWYSEQG